MASGHLSLSTTTTSARSIWYVNWDTDGEYYYGNPSTGYGYVTVTVPSSMSGATFNSVSFTYNQSGGTGWSAPYINGTNTLANNANILSRLQKGQDVSLEFRFVANGGYGTCPYMGSTVQKSETRTFTNISITVDYTPPGKIGKTVTVTNCGTCEIRLNDVSMAAGESGTATLIATPTKAITKIVAKVRVGTSGHVETYTINKSIAANNTASTSFTLAPLAAWFPTPGDRVNDTYVQFVFTSGGTDYSSSWTKLTDATYGDFELLRERAAPIIYDVQFSEPTGTTTHISTYGNPIAGKTYLDVSFNVTLDTSADVGISQSGASFTINNVTYTPINNACSLQPVVASGSVAYSISVTDSYGQVGTLTGTQTFLSYTEPTMTGVSVERYTTSVDQGGTTIYVLSDDSTTVWLNSTIKVQTDLGTKNLFNKNATDTNNGYISGQYIQSNGNPTTPGSSVVWAVSEYIPVSASTSYTLSGLPTSSASLPSICWYTSSKQYIDGAKYSNAATVTVTLPSTAAFVRISVPGAQIDQLQLEAGSSATSYSPYLCANTWSLAYTMDGGASTNIYQNQTTTSIVLDDARGLITDTVSASDDHTFVLTLSDQFTSFVTTVVVSKAGAIFDIEPGGVAVGMRCTGTEAGGEKFQVAYPTELLNDVSIANITSLEGKEYDTGWVDLSSYMITSVATVRDSLCRVRRVGHICMMQVSLTTKSNFSLNSGNSVQVMNEIPAQFINGAYMRIAALCSNGAQMFFSLQGTGTVYLYNRSGAAITGEKWVNATLTYIV